MIRRVFPTVPYAELRSGPEAAGVLDELARARLVTCDEHTVTVAHEVLIRRWPRLRSRLSADRDQLRAHRRRTEATAEWQQHARDDAFLWRGSRLGSWQDRSAERLNEAERDDGGLRIWRTAGERSAVVLRGFGSPVQGVAFGPAPDELATGHDDGTLRLSRCEVCGSLDRIRALAAAGAVRDFTDEEMHTYLHQTP
jgi:hypothetical protein